MKLYHFLRKEHGLSAIRDRRVKIARISELNDPFEYIHFDTSNYVAQAVLKERKRKANQNFGLVCLSARFDDPVQWAHYGESHRGICLGFEITAPGLLKVEYVDSRTPPSGFREALDLPVPEFIRQTLSKKYKHWRYEQEHRLIVPASKTSDLIFHSFSETFCLTEVLIGAKCTLTLASLRSLLGHYSPRPSVSKMVASPSIFGMERLA